MPWDGKTWDDDGTMFPKPGPGHWQSHKGSPDKLQWVLSDGTPTVFVKFGGDMNEDRVPDWHVTNQDDKPLFELRGIEWDEISTFKYWLRGREVSRDEFDAEFDAQMQKWREEDNA